MTVSYSHDLSSTTFLTFLKLLFRWRGSIWKFVLKELIIFITTFAIISAVYHSDYFLSADQRMMWSKFSTLFDKKLNYIPLTFMLGFFVTIIIGRWNQIFNNMGWIESAAILTATYLRGNDEKSRMMRRNVIRYMVLTQVLVFRNISLQVRRRLPTLDTVVASGFMTEAERDKYVAYNNKYTKVYLPTQWCYTLIYEARVSGKLSCDLMMNEIIKHVADFRNSLAKLNHFDWVPIPLVYPQVVFLAVRLYFLICLIARQTVLAECEVPKGVCLIFPLAPLIMTSLEFIFYVGWMKVAESLLNPLGEDDDDFECNYLLDRNLNLGLSIVDECYNELPLQEKDVYWNSKLVEPLYSAETAGKPIHPQVGSAAHYEPREDEVIMMPHADDDELEDFSVDDPEAHLLPRGVSVVSVNRKCGSRSRRPNRKGFVATIRKQFSRGGRRIPNRFDTPQMTPNSGAKKTVEVVSESSSNIPGDPADDAPRNSSLLTPKNELTPTTHLPQSPTNDILTSVPEENEENQGTRSSTNLRQ